MINGQDVYYIKLTPIDMDGFFHTLSHSERLQFFFKRDDTNTQIDLGYDHSGFCYYYSEETELVHTSYHYGVRYENYPVLLSKDSFKPY